MGSDGGSAGPVAVEPMPGYWELLSRGSGVMLGAWRDCSRCGLELSTQTLLENAYITWTEVALFFFCAFLWTMVRRGLTESLFKVGNMTGIPSLHDRIKQRKMLVSHSLFLR